MQDDTQQIQWTSMKIFLSLDIHLWCWGTRTQRGHPKGHFIMFLFFIWEGTFANKIPILTYKRSIKWYFAALRMQGSPVDWTSAQKLKASQIWITSNHEHHQQLLRTLCTWQQMPCLNNGCLKIQLPAVRRKPVYLLAMFKPFLNIHAISMS